jgi:hypothetical protein
MRRSNGARALLVALATLFLSALAPARDALAYCRTSSCGPKGGPAITGSSCTPSQETDCGIPLFWPTLCVSYSLQKDASVKISFEVADEIFEKAFATWMSAPCEDGTPQIAVKQLEPVECEGHEYNQKVGNANSIIFRDDGWPYEGANSTLALTTVTYNLDDGQIYDADMELNSAEVPLSVGDGKVEFDLLSIATHEAGHFLGLAHSADATATMYPAYNPGDTSLRDLSDDDRAGICAIYPPGDIDANCDPTPRHGFSTLCAAAQEEQQGVGCCAVAPFASAHTGGVAFVAAALGAMLTAARRRRRARPKRR